MKTIILILSIIIGGFLPLFTGCQTPSNTNLYISEATCLHEAESIAVNLGICCYADYSRSSIEVANAVNKQLFDLKIDYGLAYDSIVAVNLPNMPMIAFSFSVVNNKQELISKNLTINIDGFANKLRVLKSNDVLLEIYNNYDLVNKHLQTDTTNWIVSKSIEDLIAHEYGHVLSFRFKTLSEYISFKFGILSKGDSTLSGYSGFSGAERLAEIFVKHYRGDKLRQKDINFWNKNVPYTKIKDTP